MMLKKGYLIVIKQRVDRFLINVGFKYTHHEGFVLKLNSNFWKFGLLIGIWRLKSLTLFLPVEYKNSYI